MTLTAGVDGPKASPGGFPQSSPGKRLAQRRWRDPRLIVGVSLVVFSGLATALVVSAADERVQLWAVRADVPAGVPLTSDRLEVVDAYVPRLTPYWSADAPVPSDAVATRDFMAGELVTREGIEAPDTVDVRVVTLPVLRNQMPADLSLGDRVDVYMVERDATGRPSGEPQVVLRAAIVAGVDDDSGAFGGSSLESAVALSLPDAQVTKVLDAQARGTLTLVDVPVTTP